MYQELIESAVRPFRATPDPAFYFPFESISGVRQTVVRALTRAEGPTLVLGGAGLGKSLLVELIANDLRDRFDIVRLSSARLCSRRALLQNILFELGMEYRGLSEGELRLSILDRLEPTQDRPVDGVLLLVDEAHTLPVKLLDELRLINNFSRNGQPRTRLALFGSLRLEDTFAEPSLDSFSQRLAARCYLQPMNKRDTAEFIRHQLRIAGTNPAQVITQEGLDCIYAASEGVPRLANQVMDHALMLAIANCQCPISASLVEEAWADLQQLPAPWHSGHSTFGSTPRDAASENTAGIQVAAVEFGALDEDHAWSDEVDNELDIQAANTATQPTNFFAAFSNIPEDEFEEHIDDPHEGNVAEGNIDEEVEQDVVPEYSTIVATRDADHEEGSTMDNFFAGRLTDAELLALEDEQNQYDTLGMWENDPPLLPIGSSIAEAVAEFSEADEQRFNGDEPQTVGELHAPEIPGSLQATVPDALFGADFEEEIQVPSRPTTARPHTAVAFGESGVSTQAEDVSEYVLRLQEYANSFVQAQVCGISVDVAETLDTQPISAESSGMQVDLVGADDLHALNIARDIEDLVSQLNFSAFSVEPYSVEQIPLNIAQPQIHHAEDDMVNDSARSDMNGKDLFVLHKPPSLEGRLAFDSASAEYIDDRDLLVIEDEVLVAPKTTSPEKQPPAKLAPYNQLFARLRK